MMDTTTQPKGTPNYITALLFLYGVLSGCTVGKCIEWEEVFVAHPVCHTGSTYGECEISHNSQSVTTLETVCTARAPLEAEGTVVQADRP